MAPTSRSMGMGSRPHTKLHELAALHLQIKKTNSQALPRKVQTMKQETITVAVRISMEDYQVLQAQVHAGNFKRMSDAVRACISYTVQQLHNATAEGNTNESQ